MANDRDHDPVKSDQGGRLMPVDPGEPIHTVSEEKIRVRAYFLYEHRRGMHGDPEGDWFQAEADLLRKD